MPPEIAVHAVKYDAAAPGTGGYVRMKKGCALPARPHDPFCKSRTLREICRHRFKLLPTKSRKKLDITHYRVQSTLQSRFAREFSVRVDSSKRTSTFCHIVHRALLRRLLFYLFYYSYCTTRLWILNYYLLFEIPQINISRVHAAHKQILIILIFWNLLGETYSNILRAFSPKRYRYDSAFSPITQHKNNRLRG